VCDGRYINSNLILRLLLLVLPLGVKRGNGFTRSPSCPRAVKATREFGRIPSCGLLPVALRAKFLNLFHSVVRQIAQFISRPKALKILKAL
jgi:hypothetical protein